MHIASANRPDTVLDTRTCAQRRSRFAMAAAALAIGAMLMCSTQAARAITVHDANAAMVANEVPDGFNTNPFGPFTAGYGLNFGDFTAFTAAQHTDSALGANPMVQGYSIPNNAFVPGALVNVNTVSPTVTTFGVTLAPSQILLHPGNPGANGFDVPASNGILRFTVPTTGSYVIAGDWQSLASGATVNSVLHNGAPLASSAANDSTFNMTHTLYAGETIDFVVNAGGDGIGNDSTGLRATLTLQDEPANGTMYRAGADLRAFEQANSGPLAPVNGAWRYGTSDTLGGTFNPFSPSEHTDDFPLGGAPGAFQGWYDNAGDVVPIMAVNMTGGPQTGSCCGTFAADQIWVHPETDASNRTFDIVRWIAPADGTVDVSATWVQIDTNGMGTVHVLLNGVPGLFDSNTVLPGAGTTFTAALLAVSAGDTLDFVIGPHANDGGNGSTSTGFDAKITFHPPVPEPATATLAMLGLAGLLLRRRRAA